MTLLYDVFDAYLSPLLQKHQAGQLLVWEDLESSREASAKVLGSSDNYFVSKRLDSLHRSQVEAYREAGTKALQQWAQSLPLEPMEETDTKETFIKRCIEVCTKTQPPCWNGIENSTKVIEEEIKKRAAESFEKYNPEGTDGEAEGEGETEGDVTEDGEADTEEEEVESSEQKDNETATTPKVKNKLNKNKPKNKVVRKKGNGPKGAMRKKIAGNRRGKKPGPNNAKSG